MATTSRLFNGSTFSFSGTATAKLLGITYKCGGQTVDCTEPEDANVLYEVPSQSDFSVSLKLRGGTTLTHGTKGTAAITWKDGTTTTCPGTWVITDVSTEGSWNQPISSTVELKPTVPDA